MSKQSTTRFDNWDDVVECNNCAKYWDDSCDGVSKGSTRSCTSFIATRNIVIPQQIKSLEKRVQWLEWVVGIGGVIIGIMIILLGIG